jgi:hypothetical protein
MPTAPNTGSDSARVQLRGILANYFHAQEPAAPRGYHKWTIPAAGQPSPKLLVGDPVILMVSQRALSLSAPVSWV